MVIVKIWGGLGNQLFQYCFGQYLSAKLNTIVKYDIQTINNANNFTQRALGLSSLNINLTIASIEEVDKMKYFKGATFSRVERKLAQQFPFFFKRHKVESNLPEPPENILLSDNCYYEGYWQSYKYLLINESKLLKEFTIKQPYKETMLNLLNDIELSWSVSIHIRRGDYISNKENLKFFSLCSMHYYEAAIYHFKVQQEQVKFFIFSDDEAWCKDNFKGPQFVFVTGNQPSDDLFLMSKCRHNIIANSSFSWWAAWLNTNPFKIIITPKKWHKGFEGNLSDLVPENWIKLDN